jgi:hypothetical protein
MDEECFLRACLPAIDGVELSFLASLFSCSFEMAEGFSRAFLPSNGLPGAITEVLGPETTFDRGGVPDLSVSGDKSDFGRRRPSQSDYDEQARSANAITELTPCSYRPCWSKFVLIMKINSCAQSTNDQEVKASNLNITRRWSLQYDEQALSANAIAELTPCSYRPCWSKIGLITKINSCAQSTNEQEVEASNLNITRRWSLQYMKAALCGCWVVAKANL